MIFIFDFDCLRRLGIMLVGSQAGKPVQEAKPFVRLELIAAGHALAYFEPEKRVTARTGDVCVVAFCDQWYLTYGDEDWQDKVMAHVK